MYFPKFNPSIQWCAALATIFFFNSAAFSAAQTVGGKTEVVHRWKGDPTGSHWYTQNAFGVTVDSAGDVDGDSVTDFIIGDPFADPEGRTNAGSIYVYSGASGDRLYQLDGGYEYSRLGGHVSGAGDVNNDGFDDFMYHVPAPDWEDLASVNVISGRTGTPLFSIRDSWFYYGYGDSLGESMDALGDLDQDGFDDLLIGTRRFRDNDAGVVMVISGRTQQAIRTWIGLDSRTSLTTMKLGKSVSCAGDVNKDGYPDVIAGAEMSGSSGRWGNGAALVLSGKNGRLLHQFEGTESHDRFGSSVSGAGDLDRDGYEDLIVGAPFHDYCDKENVGEAYAYSGRTGQRLFKWRGRGEDDYFGYSVAGVGDIDSDGFDDVIIGAPNAGGTGIAFVYSGYDGELIAKLKGKNESDSFGHSIAGVDGGGDRFDVIIGAPGYLDPGGAVVINHETFLGLSKKTVSIFEGGRIRIELNFPIEAAQWNYKVLISESGTGPTTYGVEIPLTVDQMVMDSFHGKYPVYNHSNMHGILDADGKASAYLVVPADLPAAMLGASFYFAAVANPAGSAPKFSSVAKKVMLTLY